MLKNLADDKDDNKGKGGQGLSRDEAVKKVQNNPVFKAEEARIRKNLDELNEEYAEIEKRLERHQR